MAGAEARPYIATTIMNTLKFSIITPSFNQGRYLDETIRSVLDQGYHNLEYIVIDGGSSDDSVEIIKRYESRLAYWVSEPDRGQTHAINKGLARVTGDVVAYINSDDVYLPGAFDAVAARFRHEPQCEWLCGDTDLFWDDRRNTELVTTVIPKSAAHCLSWAYRAPQPGMFWRRALMGDGFDERWRYCFDHEFYVRLLLAGRRCEHLAQTVAGYRLHGSSKTVAEAIRFDEDFDAIAKIYERRLEGSDRRWCAATRFLRQSYSASLTGDSRRASACLLRALTIHPEGLLRRPFWGCARQLLLGARKTGRAGGAGAATASLL